ncbi:c8ea898d-5195-493a-9ee8-6f130cb892d5-CDS [Sclerotinia trifoliorum]|uniref:C8ea898d-5195-493a-9ee8-6f130cb892d5-CDS n=1 Tax=Sclerotinia trifoliorum TaxID=28548 RepID=A0A8H2VUA3_9HELO|nr:c8ea898d-5195-493a-9ee8-6f130cb892d5-CDS [Sclerotinia trifoliorum]
MQAPSTQKTSNTIALKRLRSSGSSGRHRPGSRARHGSQHEITASALTKQYPPSAHDFPPLGFTVLPDSSVFGSTSGGIAGANITEILARTVDISTSSGTAEKRDGNVGMEMHISIAANTSRRSMRPKSISANYTTPIGEFMGGKRGEMTQDGSETSSYIGAAQFSRRGNLLPSRSSTSATGISTRNNNGVSNTNSAPNPFSMTAAAGTSLTHRSAPYEISKNFDRLRVQGAHLGLVSSPYFPKCKEDLVKHREGRKNDARDAMNQRIKDKEEVMRLKSERAYVKVKTAFLGKVFRDGLSGVFARRTIWGHPSLDGELCERAEWPTLPELKQAGIRKMGLPVPRYKGEDGMAGEEVKAFAGDRVGLGRRRAEEKVMFDEQDIKELGQMASLFEAIDG